MKRFLGQYIFHNNSFAKRGFLQINDDNTTITRLAKPGEEWGNTQFINGILFPVYSDKSDKVLLKELRSIIPQLLSKLSESDNILEAIQEIYINKNTGKYAHWFALKGIDLSDLSTVIQISLSIL